MSPYLTTIRKERTTHRTLQELASELARMQDTKHDFIVDTRRMSFVSDDDGSVLSSDTPTSTPGVCSGVVLDHAHGQIASRLNIPKKYYDRMRSDAPFLLDENVRHWFYKSPERRMIRMLDGNVRAFLSDRFRRLDNYDLMERSVLPALHDIEGLEFHVASLTPERLIMRAILPSLQREIGLRVGDIVQAGFQFRNSEVGSAAFTVAPFIWKLDCLNGMVSNIGAMRAYHVGRRIEDTEEANVLYASDTLASDDRTFYLQARDAIRQAVSETSFDQTVDLIRAAGQSATIVAPVAATEKLAQTYSLNDGERDGVLASLARGGDLSRWGLINAVTDSAKDADTFDRQEEIERIGGMLLTVAGNDWGAIATAA